VIVNYAEEVVKYINGVDGVIESKVDRGCRAYDYARFFDLLRSM